MDKLDFTLTKAKGCFAFFDIKDDGSRNVLRFNSLGFKDNYRQGNLLNMNLRLYTVNVGNTWIAELAAGKELSLEGFHLPPIRIMSDLPLETGSFNLACAFETVCFWPGPVESFREVFRILGPEGTFLIVNESDGLNEGDRKWLAFIDGLAIYGGGTCTLSGRSLLLRSGSRPGVQEAMALPEGTEMKACRKRQTACLVHEHAALTRAQSPLWTVRLQRLSEALRGTLEFEQGGFSCRCHR